MRIVVYCKDYAPMETGFAIAFRGFCEALVKHNADVHITVVTPSKAKESADDTGVAVERISVVRLQRYYSENNSPNSNNIVVKIHNTISTILNRFLWSRDLARIFSQDSFDYMLFESGDDMLLMSLLPPAILKKVAIRFHSTGDTETARYSSGVLRRIERILIRHRVSRHVKVILATNEFHLGFIKSFYYGDDPYQLAQRYFGIVPNVVRDEHDYSAVINDQMQVESDSDYINIVTLGRMDKQGVAQKGFEDLLFAISSLKTEDINKIKVIIIGDGEKRNELVDLSNSLGLVNIKFMGRMNNAEVRRTLRRSEVVALVSRFEGLSMFAIEGMLCSSAVLFTKAGALADLVDGNGWLVDVQSIDQIAAALTEIARTDKAKLHDLGGASHRIATDRFSEESVARSGYIHLRNCQRFLARQ